MAKQRQAKKKDEESASGGHYDLREHARKIHLIRKKKKELRSQRAHNMQIAKQNKKKANGGQITVFRSIRSVRTDTFMCQLRRRCEVFNERSEEKPGVDPGHGRAPCARCGRIIGRRCTAKITPYKCRPNCPDKKVYCSNNCRDLEGHKCTFYKYSEPNPDPDPEVPNILQDPELQFPEGHLKAGNLIADIPILVRFPRVCYAEDNSDRGGIPQICVPCIQCGLLEDEFITDSVIKEDRIPPDVEIIHVTNYEPNLAKVEEEEPLAIRCGALTRLCKKCGWPLCDACKGGKDHSSDCYELTNVNRMRKKYGLPHPFTKNPDYAMLFVGLMRLYQLKKWKCPEYLVFEDLITDVEKARSGPRRGLRVYERSYLRLFLTQFAPYLECFGLTKEELKDICETMLFYRVDSNAVTWPRILSANGGRQQQQQGTAGDAGALLPFSVATRSEYLLLGMKFQFGCNSNITLTKRVNENRLLVKTLVDVKQGDRLTLGLHQGITDAGMTETFNITDLGYGDNTFQRGKHNTHRQCTESTCRVCEGNKGRLSATLKRFFRVPRPFCGKCRRLNPFKAGRFLGGATVIVCWKCTNCEQLTMRPEREAQLRKIIDGFKDTLGNHLLDDAGYHFRASLNEIKSKKLCWAEQLLVLSGVMRLVHQRLCKMLFREKLVPLPLFTHGNVRLLCETFFELWHPDFSFTFRIEAARTRMVRIMSWLVLPTERPDSAEDFDSKQNELVEAINGMTLVAGECYDSRIYVQLFEFMRKKCYRMPQLMEQ